MKKEECEKWLERELVRRIEREGGIAYKLHSELCTGMPDRLCVRKGGRVTWIELKSRGAKLRARQELMIGRLRALGAEVLVIDSLEKLDDYIQSR